MSAISGFAVLVAVCTPVSALAAGPTTTASPSANTSGTSSMTEVEDLPDVAPSDIDSDPNPAELEDLATVAGDRGLNLDAAIEQFGWRDNFGLMVAQISAVEPGAVAGAAVTGPESAWIAYAQAQSPAATATVAEFGRAHPGLSIEARTGLGFSQEELDAAVQDVHFAVMEVSDVADTTTFFDYETSRIEVSIQPAAPSAALPDEAANAAREALSRRGGVAGSVRVSVRVVDAAVPFAVSDAHYGGEVISACTTGFGTRTLGHTVGSRGISTAGHCGDTQYDDGSKLTFKKDYEGVHGDFQWHSGAQTMTDDFYAGSSSSTETDLRDVAAVAAPYVGQSLCRNGASSHKDCQEVRKVGVCNGSRCNLVEMGARLAAGGDSGGPVYWGNTAYGLHQGSIYDPVWPYDRDVFSRADRIDNALNVHVATS